MRHAAAAAAVDINAVVDARVAQLERATESDMAKMYDQMNAHVSSVDSRLTQIERGAQSDADRAQHMLDAHIASADARMTRIERNAESDTTKLRQLETETQNSIRGIESSHLTAFTEFGKLIKQTAESVIAADRNVSDLGRLTQAMSQTMTSMGAKIEQLQGTALAAADQAAMATAIASGAAAAAQAPPPPMMIANKTPVKSSSVYGKSAIASSKPTPSPPKKPSVAKQGGILKRAADRFMRLVGRRKSVTNKKPSPVVAKSARNNKSPGRSSPSTRTAKRSNRLPTPPPARSRRSPQNATPSSPSPERSPPKQQQAVFLPRPPPPPDAVAAAAPARPPPPPDAAAAAPARPPPPPAVVAAAASSSPPVRPRPNFLNQIENGAPKLRNANAAAAPAAAAAAPAARPNFLDQIANGQNNLKKNADDAPVAAPVAPVAAAAAAAPVAAARPPAMNLLGAIQNQRGNLRAVTKEVIDEQKNKPLPGENQAMIAEVKKREAVRKAMHGSEDSDDGWDDEKSGISGVAEGGKRRRMY